MLSQVPSLNSTPLERLNDGCLVTYTGMVQDHFDPELYLQYYTAINPSTGHKVFVYGGLADRRSGCSILLRYSLASHAPHRNYYVFSL